MCVCVLVHTPQIQTSALYNKRYTRCSLYTMCIASFMGYDKTFAGFMEFGLKDEWYYIFLKFTFTHH